MVRLSRSVGLCALLAVAAIAAAAFIHHTAVDPTAVIHVAKLSTFSSLSAFAFAPLFGTTSSANTPRVFEAGDYESIPVADNVKIYEGSAVGDNGSGYGRALQAADPFRGFCVESADNTVSGHTAGGIYVQVMRKGRIHLPFSGAAVGDLGKAVYASDDMTFTYTATSNSYIGRVVRYVSATEIVVSFDAERGAFSKETSLTDNSGGTAAASTGVSANASKNVILIPLGSMALLVNSQVFKLAIPYAFQVTSALFRDDVAITTGAKAATLTTQINGVACTGGVISVSGTYATGATQAGTAITALNTGTAGQTLEIAVSGVTTFTEGTGHVELTVIDVDAANLAATLTAAINAFNTQV